MIIFFLTSSAAARETNGVYWTDLDGSRPWRIILKPDETYIVCLKAEVPFDKVLNAYSFVLTYDPSVISIISVEKPDDSAFPPMNINSSIQGSIIFNAFNTKGLQGYAVISLLNITIKGKTGGSFNFDIKVNDFGAGSSDQFKPEPDNLSIFVSLDDVKVIPGDINHDGFVDLVDLILAARIMSAVIPERTIYKQADVNLDFKIGIQEMIYILKYISEHIPGDVNGDKILDLKDMILVLQVLCSKNTDQKVFKEADVNKDGKIGIEEAVYILMQF